MTHTRKAVVAVAAIATALAATAPANAAAPRKFKNCAAVHKVYPHGIARSRAAAARHGWEAKVSASLYAANKRMDRDRDGVACERY